jgi:ketosteroid isomerase-like protein
MQKALLFLAVAMLPLFIACGKGANPVEVQQKFFNAVDKGDVAGALAYVSDDAVFQVLGCPPDGCKGKVAVKVATEGVVAQHPRHTVTSSKVSGNTATSRVEVEIDLAKAAGAQRIILTTTAEIKDGKLVLLRAQLDVTDPQTAIFAQFLQRQPQPAR